MNIELTSAVITASVICAVGTLAIKAYAASHTNPPYETSFEHRVRLEREQQKEKAR